MFASDSLNLETANPYTVIDSHIKFLKVKAHKYGMYFYLPIPDDQSKRKLSDIIKLAYEFYNTKIHYEYLLSLQYDNIKMKAHSLYMKRGYVLWKDLTGTCKFKELITDCSRENAIELVLDYNLSEYL
jgi:hypothetical protein